MTGPGAAPIRIASPEGDRPFDAAALERVLRGMWKAAASSRGTIYRAAMANLIVPHAASDFDRIGPVLIDVTRRHPARLFLVERRDSTPAGSGLRGRATAVCHLRPGGGGLVCSEQIAITWDDASGPLVPSAVASLLVGDLPSVLLELNRGADPAWQEKLATIADVRIVDSNLASGLADYPATWRRHPGRAGCPLHDLAWARLAPWREILAEAFDRPEPAAAIASLQDLTIRHTGAEPPPGAWLLAGWIASRLRWVPRQMNGRHIRFDAPGRPVSVGFEEEVPSRASGGRASAVSAPHAIVEVRLRSGAPTPLDLSVEHAGHAPTARVTMRSPRVKERDVPFAYRELAACIVGEIHRHEPNLAFEDAARSAEEMIALWRKG